ncbi:MAG: PD-(D/E)XK nuclease family protein, partial [Clostridia bacterium]|nr:PD-(D/E)XK nuclease family protein [Clostridia bacterium]
NLIKQKNPQSDVVITQKDAQRIFDEVIQEERYQAIMRTNKGRALVNRLKTEALAHCMTILNEVESSAFKPYATEFKFDKPNKNQDADKCLSLTVGDKTVYLKGSADRVDVYQDKALIFDYKTGSPSYSAKELYDGTKLQLFVYASAVKKVLGKMPVGSVYYKVKTLSSNDDSCKIIGRVISDVDTVSKIDSKVFDKSPDGMLGEVLNKPDKFGMRTIKGTLSTYIPQDVFEDCQTYALNIIQKACELMRQGYIDVNPLKDACLYCPAKTLCGFDDTRVVAERKIPAVKETNISLILKED